MEFPIDFVAEAFDAYVRVHANLAEMRYKTRAGLLRMMLAQPRISPPETATHALNRLWNALRHGR
ncbi:MAG: hypothetical protein GXO36_03645 [Chloroflexi bacterium]|nr:hypothetical protein [Chloroflexota bacterium]